MQNVEESKLHVFLDSETLDDNYSQNKNEIDRLLLYSNKKPIIITRSVFRPTNHAISNITETNSLHSDNEVNKISLIGNTLLKRSLTDGEKEFLYLVLKFGSTHKSFNNSYIDNSLFISENNVASKKKVT